MTRSAVSSGVRLNGSMAMQQNVKSAVLRFYRRAWIPVRLPSSAHSWAALCGVVQNIEGGCRLRRFRRGPG